MDMTAIEERYRAMSPEQFGNVKRSDLTEAAASIYDREVARRLSLGFRMSDADHRTEVKKKRWGLRAFAVTATLFVVLAIVGTVADKSNPAVPKPATRLEDNPENVVAAEERRASRTHSRRTPPKLSAHGNKSFVRWRRPCSVMRRSLPARCVRPGRRALR